MAESGRLQPTRNVPFMNRIVFINRFFHPDHSATSQILSDLAFALAAEGMPITLVTSRLRYDGGGEPLPASEVIRGVEVIRVATTRFGRSSIAGRLFDYASFYASAGRVLSGLVRPGDVVVAKTDPPLISLLAYAVSRRRGARFVNWIQDLYPETAQQLGVFALKGPTGAILTRLRNATLRGADANVAIGRTMAARLISCTARPESVCVIPNWVDEASIRPVSHEANALRGQWGLRDRFVVAYSGNLGRAHEFETLLGAARILKDDTDLVFLFIGGGHHASRMGAEVERRGLSHLFCFKPYQPAERLAESLSAADVHWLSLLPQIEGLIVPSKFYGIAAVGRPMIVVADPLGELGTVVREADAGAAVAVGDAAALAAAICRLKSNGTLKERQGRNARDLAEGAFSRARALDAWRSLLTTLLEKRPAADA
jgi:colanic acid biosynthesis glycosyl transferase WcaI